MSKPFSWSFTSLEQYRTCPRQYHEVRVLRNFKDEKNEAALWGDRVHEAIATALRDGAPLPDNMSVYESIIAPFRTLTGVLSVENKLCITEQMQPCEFFAPDAWCRGIIDALWVRDGVAKAVDWKTGKRKLASDQLKLFALLTFAAYPQVNEVRTMFVWLKTGQVDRQDFMRHQISKLWESFLLDLQRVKNSLATDTWAPRTSGLCSQWCPVTTCQFNGKRRNW